MNHLLLHLLKKRLLWELLFSLFGTSWVMVSPVPDVLLSWKGASVGKRRKKEWQVAPSYLFWTVWKTRNLLVFHDDVFSIQKLKCDFLFLLWTKTKLSIEGAREEGNVSHFLFGQYKLGLPLGAQYKLV